MTLYNLRSALDNYRITKFTKDLDVESSYLMDRDTGACECPAGTRPTCRHRQMLPDLLPLLDTEYFWDFERHTCVNADGVACEPIEGLDEEEIEAGPGVAVAQPLCIDEGCPQARTDHVCVESATAEATSHSDACGKAPRPAFGSTLPPGVRLPNQKGPWRRI